MSAPLKIRSRGCSLKIDGVALPALTSIDVGAYKNKTVETVTLDGPVQETKDATGYATTPTIKASGFYDPTAYAPIKALVETPVTKPIVVTYSNDATETWTGIGYSYDKKIDPGKPVMADVEIETTGVYQ